VCGTLVTYKGASQTYGVGAGREFFLEEEGDKRATAGALADGVLASRGIP